MTDALTYLLIEILFTGICIANAYWHRHLINQNRPIIHSLWAVLYGITIIPVATLTKNPVLCISLVLIREVFFSPFLNYLRGKPFFYVGIHDSNSSYMDWIIGKANPVFYFICLAALIAFNIIGL